MKQQKKIILDYFKEKTQISDIQNRIKRWEIKYHDKPNKVFWRTIFLCLQKILGNVLYLFSLQNISKRNQSSQLENSKNTIRFLVYLRGGIGDIMLGSTYLKELYQWTDADCSFTICVTQSRSAVESLLRGLSFIEKVYHCNDYSLNEDFDVVLDVSRFPKLLFMNDNLGNVPKLKKLLFYYKTFENEHQTYYRNMPFTDTIGVMYSLMNGHTRRTQTDLGHFLGMNESTRSFLALKETAFSILEKYRLTDKKYITFQRGTDAVDNIIQNVRNWPIPYYNELIELLKLRFPSLILVHLGVVSPSVNFEGIDIDLRGQTTFEELKVVLKNSLLHIDGECGMVHLNHALNGRSAVFFGQTRVDFCGYPENINLKAEGSCPLWCEWVTEDWQKKCLQGFGEPPCMKSLTPRFVMNSIEDYLKQALNQKECFLQETTESFSNAGVYCLLGSFEEKALRFIQNENNQIFLFDPKLTRTTIQDYRQRGITAEFGDIYNIPMADESCDHIVCDINPSSEFASKEMLRILKKGGILSFLSENKHFKKTLK